MFYRYVLRPVLYLLPAEPAHHLVIGMLRLVSGWPWLVALMRSFLQVRDPALEVQAFGLTFQSPIGLAAGLDKNAEAFEALSALGFGSVEVGTITAQAQPGNPQPRLFRLPRDHALINRMGFNNHGAAAVAAQLASSRASKHNAALLGINIGKTKVVPSEAAIADYVASARLLAPYADYLVINVSSPNTPGLRDLQAVEALRPLITQVRSALDQTRGSPRIPLLLKIAPDLSDADIDAIAELALELELDGIIATNTTIERTGLGTNAELVASYGAGGLSGAPLRARSLAVLRRLRSRLGDRLPLVAAGGIANADDVYESLRAGATLVQLYTSLIYEGPLLPSRLCRVLSRRLRDEGVSHVAEIVGRDAPSRTSA